MTASGTESSQVTLEVWQNRVRAGFFIFYAIAGVMHLAYPGPFLMITPQWVPYASLIIALTGLCEIAGALGLWHSRLRKLAGIALATYAVCVFPANAKHAIDSLRTVDPTIWSWMYHCIRLPLQPLLIWGALFAGGITSWPIRKKHRQ